jgi:CRISPR/Cas system CSM-associated protein Csm5 (group 7 of RAMP superfamily)
LDIEIPMLSSFFPKLNLTESGKKLDDIKNGDKQYLTNISKNTNTEKTTYKTSNFISPSMVFEEKMEGKPKFYIKSQINNRKENKSSGGVVRLSISPSQGDDPGFKSRPEHFLVFWYFKHSR